MSPLLLLALIAADEPAEQAAPVDPSPPAVQARLEPKKVRIGERLRLDVLLKHDGRRVFRFPETLDLGDFELVDRDVRPAGPPDAEGLVTEQLTLELALFRTGEHRLPDIELPYVDPTGQEFRVTVPGGVVECTSVIANESAPELRPPPGPVPMIVEDRRPVYAAAALGIVLVSALLAFLLGRWWRGREQVVPPAPVIPAEVIARGRLQTLRSQDLPGQGLIKEFYLELSHILREYFGLRYHMNALEMTTPELLDHLTDRQLRGIPKTTVARFLDESDLVKFARYGPTEDEVAEIFRVAEEIIARTTPRPEPRVGEAGAAPA